MNSYYYPRTIRNITLALTDLFNDLVVQRLDDSGILSKEIRVPIKFGPVNKFSQLIKEAESGNKYYIKLPGLSVTLDGVNYASERATGVNEERYFYDVDVGLDNLTEFISDVQPTPYDFSYSLHILTESMDDFSQIVENILPYFNPSLDLRVKEFSFLNVERDLKVTQTGISTEFLDPQGENEKRYVNGSIQFTVKGFMYRPVSSAKVIKEIQSKYYVNGNDINTSGSNILDLECSTSGFSDISAANEVSLSAYNTSGVEGETKYLKQMGEISDIVVDGEFIVGEGSSIVTD